MQSQHKVGLSSSTSSSHVVCRDDYACSSSGFEAFSTALTVMATFLKLCLVHIHDVIRVLWSGPHSDTSAHLLPPLCSGAFDPQCVLCLSLPIPPIPGGEAKFLFLPLCQTCSPLAPPHSSCNAEVSGKEGARKVVSGRGGTGDRGESHIVFEVAICNTETLVSKSFDFLGNAWGMPTKQ